MNIKNIYNKIDKILNKKDENFMLTLEEIKKELEVEIITSGKANKSILSTFKNISKYNIKNKREAFKDVLHFNNSNVLTNGFVFVDYTDEQLPAELKPYVQEKSENRATYSNLKNTDATKTATINLQDVKKINKYNTLHKNDPIPYIVNNEFVLDTIFILDAANLLQIKDNMAITYNTYMKPCNIETSRGNALIWPIRCKDVTLKEYIEKNQEILNT